VGETAVISSLHNQFIKLVRKLYTKQGRKKENLIPLEGVRFIEGARDAGAVLELLLYSPEVTTGNRRAAQLVEDLRGLGVPTYEVESALLNSVSATETPQGLICAARPPHFTVDDLVQGSMAGAAGRSGNTGAPGPGRHLLIVGDGISDPGNVGTIVRTAAAAGARGVILTDGSVDPFSPKALRATAGAVFSVPIALCGGLEGLLGSLREVGYTSVASSLSAAHYHFEVDYPIATAFLLGNEGHGLAKWVEGLTDISVKLPLVGEVESLNVAITSGVLVYEYLRQHHQSLSL